MKKMLFVMAFAVTSFVFTQPAFSEGKDLNEHIGVMRQAANELQVSNPELSKKLNKFADKKEEWKSKEHDPKHLDQKRNDLVKIEQAETALRPTNAGLADDLKDIHDRWEKKLEEKLKGKD